MVLRVQDKVMKISKLIRGWGFEQNYKISYWNKN